MDSRASRIVQHLLLTTAFSLAALAPGHAQTVTYSCTGQMRVVKQFKNSDLGERDTFPFTENVVVDLGAHAATIGTATFPNVKVSNDRVEGKVGTFEFGKLGDSFTIDVASGEYHRMTRVPVGDYDVFSESTITESTCKKP